MIMISTPNCWRGPDICITLCVSEVVYIKKVLVREGEYNISSGNKTFTKLFGFRKEFLEYNLPEIIKVNVGGKKSK